MNARTHIAVGLRFDILQRDRFACRYCGAHAPHVKLEVDHIIPVSRNGTNHPSNLITACEACNAGKSDKLITQERMPFLFISEIRFLVERGYTLEQIDEAVGDIATWDEWDAAVGPFFEEIVAADEALVQTVAPQGAPPGVLSSLGAGALCLELSVD